MKSRVSTWSVMVGLLVCGTTALNANEEEAFTLDATQTGRVISPQLFGHNLEHTRRAISKGISAQMIENRKFAAVDGNRPLHWRTKGGAEHISIDSQVAYAGKHSVRLGNPSGGGVGIWQQQDWLTFHKHTKYVFAFGSKRNRQHPLP